MSQAIGEMDSVSGYGASNGQSETEIKEGAAESFIIDGLSKVYRVQNICNSNNLTACGIPSSIITLNGKTLTFPKSLHELNPYFTEYPADTPDFTYSNGSRYKKLTSDINAAAFETVNGESIALFYNPYCSSNVNDTWSFAQTQTCVNMIYDLNGLRGPNEVGKDVGFITVLYRTNSVVVAPNPFPTDAGTAQSYPTEDGDDASTLCTQQGDDARLPDIDELASMFVNRSLLDMASGAYWSGSVISSGSMGLTWYRNMESGYRGWYYRKDTASIRCVKR